MTKPRWKLTIQRLFLTDIIRLNRGLSPIRKPEVRLYRWRWQANLAKAFIERPTLLGPMMITRSTIEPLAFDNVVPFRREAA